MFDRNENEPEEWDPEEEFYDPDSDSLTIPQVSTDDGGDSADDLSDISNAIDTPAVSTGELDAPDELLQTFWVLVLVINAAVLAASLGLLFLVFNGDTTSGGLLLGAGLVLFGLAGHRYGQFRDANRDAGTATGTESDAGSSAEPRQSADAGTAKSAPDDAAETTSGDVSEQQSPTGNDRS